MKTWTVTIPMAGHIVVEVEADNEEAAIEKALESSYTIDDLEGWETMRAFSEGNVCYCPRPWEAEAEEAI